MIPVSMTYRAVVIAAEKNGLARSEVLRFSQTAALLEMRELEREYRASQELDVVPNPLCAWEARKIARKYRMPVPPWAGEVLDREGDRQLEGSDNKPLGPSFVKRFRERHERFLVCAWVHMSFRPKKIDILGSAAQATGARSPLLESQLKIDLHSFRGARNLFDHPVRGMRAENRRELQLHERMIQGPRLLSELLRLQRKVR